MIRGMSYKKLKTTEEIHPINKNHQQQPPPQIVKQLLMTQYQNHYLHPHDTHFISGIWHFHHQKIFK